MCKFPYYRLEPCQILRRRKSVDEILDLIKLIASGAPNARAELAVAEAARVVPRAAARRIRPPSAGMPYLLNKIGLRIQTWVSCLSDSDRS